MDKSQRANYSDKDPNDHKMPKIRRHNRRDRHEPHVRQPNRKSRNRNRQRPQVATTGHERPQ
ncbi:MAG: hypothetical protein AABY69_07320, partial [Nitrospirota bacterium]